jgi:hypothetical protein
MTRILSLSPQRPRRRRFGFSLIAGAIILAAIIYGLWLNAGEPGL